MGVNGATDTVTNANPPARNPDTVSSKDVKDFNAAVDRSTTSNDSSKQSQGTSNQGSSSSYPLILATRPPINAMANQGAPSQAGSTSSAAKKAPAATTQTVPGTSTPPTKDATVDKDAKVATPQGGATAAGAADDNGPHLEIDAQALAVANQSPGKLPSFGSLDVSASAVGKNVNVWEHKLGPGELSIGHEPQAGLTLSSHVKDPSDAATPGVTRPPAVSVHPQVSAQVGVANYTIKHGKDDLVEVEVDVAGQVDLYGGKPQVQGSVQAGVELHLTDKVSTVGQVSIPFATSGGPNPPPSAGVGLKVAF